MEHLNIHFTCFQMFLFQIVFWSVLVHVSHSNACSKSQIGPIGWPIGSAAPPVAGVSVALRPGIKLCPSRNVVPFSRSNYKPSTVNKTLLSWSSVLFLHWKKSVFFTPRIWDTMGYPIFRPFPTKTSPAPPPPLRWIADLPNALQRSAWAENSPSVSCQFLGGSNIVYIVHVFMYIYIILYKNVVSGLQHLITPATTGLPLRNSCL